MKKPNIIALPTSQMQTLCDILGLGEDVQSTMESMIEALEAADFRKLRVVKAKRDEPRPPNSIGYELAEVEPEEVAKRKKMLGRV